MDSQFMAALKRVFFVAFAMVAFLLNAADKLISRVDIDVQLVNPPTVEYRKAMEVAPKTTSTNRWAMIRIEYTVEKSSLPDPELRKVVKRSGSGYELKLVGFVDDLQLRLRVLMDTGLKIDRKSFYAMFTGGVGFYTVQGDGKRHLVWLFIPAKLIDRCSQYPNGNLRKVAKGDFRIEAVFNAGGREVAREYWGAGGRRGFNEALEMVPENMIFQGWVLPRAKTPWALLGADDFDLEKELPIGRK